MRRILCFGDSNTYGYSPVDGQRFGDDINWPGVLNTSLEDKFEIINEGKNGRTIAFDDPYNEGCNGMSDIEECLERNEPLDAVIIMLGTNDLKVYFDATPQTIADNLKEMCNLIKEKTEAKILIASPTLLGDQIEFSPLHLEFGRTQVDYSFELAPAFQKIAQEVGADFMDLAMVAISSDVDCLHLMPEEHAKVAQAMKDKVLKMFQEELAEEARIEEEEKAAELKRIQEEEEKKQKEEEERRQAEEAAKRQAEEEEKQRLAEEEEKRRLAEEEEKRLLEEERIRAEEERQKAEEAARLKAQEAEEEARLMAAKAEEEARLQAAKEEEEARKKAAEEEEAQKVEEEARLKVEAILKAAEEEVAREENIVLETADEGSSMLDSAEFAEIPAVGELQASIEEETVEAEEESASSLTNSDFVDLPIMNEAEVPVVEELEEVPTVSGLTEVLGESMHMSEKERMLSGQLYRCNTQLKGEANSVRKLTAEYNMTAGEETEKRTKILNSLFGKTGRNAYIEPPFRCDYGSHISIGDNFYANFDCVMIDTADIKIGNFVFLGPRVNIYTACYPIFASVRNQQLEYSKEVTIGDDVWIGGNVTINPGVHIGSNVVIGSGSVVTGDIPDGVVAAGNPCRIIRRISDEDKTYWEKKKAEYDAN